MYYYAEVNSDYAVVAVYALESESTNENYKPITKEQYEDPNFIGWYWDYVNEVFLKPEYFSCHDYEIQYRDSQLRLSTKLDEMCNGIDTAIAGNPKEYAISVNGKSGEVVLSAEDVGAATPDPATVTDNGLMSASDKLKLDGISDGANKYTHPTYTAKASGLYKVTVDNTGHVSSASAVTKADITALGIPSQDTNTTYNNATTGASGLMSATDKTKLDGIASGANKYSHPAYTAKSSGLYKVSVDGTGHVNSATAVTKADITALGIPAQDTNTTYGAATTTAAGLMSAADKTKLNGIAAGAQKNTVTGIKGNAEGSYRTGNVNLTPGNLGCGDFVVSAGASGAWTYRKWNTGVVECWRKITGTITNTGTWNGFKTFSGSADFPTGLFKAVPCVEYSCYIGSGFAVPARGCLSTAAQFKWAALGSDPASNIGYIVDVYAVGKWK